MSTIKTTIRNWDKPVFPSDNLATELDSLIDQIDAHSHSLGELTDVTATGEGAGNGFDADLLDGNHASAFAFSSVWTDHGQVNHDVIKSWNGVNEQAFATLEPRPVQASKLPAADTAAYLSSQNEYDDNVHAKSDNSGQLTYEQAVQYAEERGGRLPTLEEVEGGVTMGSGSGYDGELIWTQTKSGPDSHYVQYGKYTNYTNDPRTTREARDNTATAVVRWVADADQSNLPATVDSNGHIYDGNGTNLADQIFHAEGTGTNINGLNNVSWNNTIINDGIYSFDGTNVTIQTEGWYEIEADVDYYANNTRVNANIFIQVNGSTVGVMGKSGYVRDNSGHNEASVHTRAVQQLSSGDTVKIKGRQEAQSYNVNPARAQFTIKKLHR